MSALREGFESRVHVPLPDLRVESSGKGDGSYTIQGHAAIYNQLSHSLGSFRERIEPGAFTKVLAERPPVLCVWDHDTSKTLASTKNATLKLTDDPVGLAYWARVAPTSYAADLRVLLERADVSQASFMFRIGRERWEKDADGGDVAVIEEVSALYDVTVTARGAYPQTDSHLATLARSRFEAARKAGLLSGGVSDAARDHRIAVEQAKLRRAKAGGA